MDAVTDSAPSAPHSQTLSRGIRVLEVLGLLRTQTGSGPESGAIIIARPSGGMSSLIRLQVAALGTVGRWRLTSIARSS